MCVDFGGWARFAGVTLLALAAAGCHPPGLRVDALPARAGGAVCLDYQPCLVTGTLLYRALGGGRAEAAVTRADGSCVPLLLSEGQRRAAARLVGRAVAAEGLSLVRLADGGAETLEVAYFDRHLSPGACAGRTVLYVRSLAKVIG